MGWRARFGVHYLRSVVIGLGGWKWTISSYTFSIGEMEGNEEGGRGREMKREGGGGK